METIRERISRLATLTADELTQLRADILAEFERLDTDAASVEDIAAMQELAEFGGQLQSQEAERAQQAAEQQANREAARQAITALNPEPSAEEESETEPETEEPAEPTAEEPEAEPAADPAAEPVTAGAGGGSQVARMAGRQPTPQRGPEAGAPERRRATLVASGSLERHMDIRGPIENAGTLAEGMSNLLARMPRNGAPRGEVLCASARFEYPDERRLGSDAWVNGQRMDAVTNLQALTATGGICAPTNVDYEVPTWATADRPVRDALPGFEATRGGVLYVQPPDIGALAGATGIWTEATDLSPGASTKPIIQVQCGNTVQVFVEAVSTRLGFGNMQARFAPEQVAANTDLAVAAASRIAENNLLNLLAAAAVTGVTQGLGGTVGLGATRDLITAINQAVAAYRNSHRIPRSQTITAVFPDWLRELIKIDLAREIGHAQDSSWNSLMISDQQVDDLLENAGVRPVYHLDGQPNSVSGGVAQTFAVQSGSTTIETFPTKMVWYLFAEGQVQFLDGGRLDLGVVRDSTLDATNDYETFVETFEGLAFRGFTGGLIQYVSTLCANGSSAGTVDMHATCA